MMGITTTSLSEMMDQDWMTGNPVLDGMVDGQTRVIDCYSIPIPSLLCCNLLEHIQIIPQTSG
uniref:Uncharacterized protein n=1 Tax=uncultured marine virus TaxID=186617 RepID=A0A0F7L856_9VIRU|nr:hypothetical protein [uncultured marine virus]